MRSGIKDWYVITGGPSAGSSTLISALAKRGFTVEPEAARALIDRELAKGRTLDEIRRDEQVFQREVLALKTKREKDIPSDKTVFFDRAVPDTIAYYKAHGAPPVEIEELLKASYPYKKVFLLDMAGYQADYSRVEDAEIAAAIHALLEESYRQVGVPVVKVPFLPVEERVDFVLSRI